MIHFALTFESRDPVEVAALSEAIRAVCSDRVELVRSVGERHCLQVQIGGSLDEGFHQDLAALFAVAVPLIHEFDPDGHWHIERRPGWNVLSMEKY